VNWNAPKKWTTALIPFLKPNLDLSDLGSRLGEIQNERYSNFGPVETRFCDAMRDTFFLPSHHVVAASNATIGLSCALSILDEVFHSTPAPRVLCPSFTFSATGMAARFIGKEVVLYDITPDLQPDIDQIIDFLDASRAPITVILYEVFGNQIDPQIVNKLIARGQPIVIDCAASLTLPSNHKRVLPKTVQVFSLHATKPFPTIEGGLIVANDHEMALTQIRSHINFGFRGKRSSEVVATNGKMGEINSLVGLQTLDAFPRLLAAYHRLAKMYRAELGEFLHTVPVFGSEPAYQFFPAIFSKSVNINKVLHLLEEQQVFAYGRYFNPPLHAQPVFMGSLRAGPLKGSEWLSSHAISLPLYSKLSDENVERVIDAVTKVARNSQSDVMELGSEVHP
jgi:dTDP-4-amino-4,6-dideoxygalactose transaminase